MSLDIFLNSWPLEPEEVKRREYYGIAMFVVGAICILAGTLCLAFALELGALLTCTGIIAMLTGPWVLDNIPIVALLPEHARV